MPALWQSSQRPMYVRTVWVDGFRHAILSHDDPYLLKLNAKRRRPHSSASTTKLTKNSRLSDHDDLDVCLRKFNFVIRSDKSKFTKRQQKNSQEFEIEKLNLTDVDPESDDEQLLVKATPQPLNEFDSCRSDNSVNINMKNLRLNRTSRTEGKENTDLSDRVLQWLDLAGKIDMLAPENPERMSQPRHSWPEIQRRNHHLIKSKTTIDVRGRDAVKMPSPKAYDEKPKQNGIDRQEFYVPTSANTIENYARQSRNAKSTPRVESVSKVKDNAKTKARELKTSVMETRQKMASERNAVEKQYADLVSKKLIPDMSKGNKRQVHIFIPELQKKLNTNVTSRAESLLSQKS